MTTRIGQPDTDADLKLRDNLGSKSPNNFILVAGAGSGKTTSLVKALGHISATRGRDLRQRKQHVACITYTEIAAREIWGDVGNDPLFHISTIHSFLWEIISPFQRDIQQRVEARLQAKIAEAQTKIADPKTRKSTIPQLESEVERYERQKVEVAEMPRFKYGAGSNYSQGILGHSDILEIGSSLITERPLLKTLVARRFPYIFVDESQDTSPAIVAALTEIAESVSNGFCLGFFGDPMQKIYATGIGDIPIKHTWERIVKENNFRCPVKVLDLINRIRAEDDGIQQVGGRKIENSDILMEGTARLFILPADEHRTANLERIKHCLEKENEDPLWHSEVRLLILVHRMAAQRLGFLTLYDALNHKAPLSLKEGLIDGTAWVLQPFLRFVLPLVQAAKAGKEYEVISILRRDCPLFSKEQLPGQKVAPLLKRVRESVTQLVEMLDEHSEVTVAHVLDFAKAAELISLDERFSSFLETTKQSGGENSVDDANNEQTSINAFLNCHVCELWGYQHYLGDQSPFATQQGVKGAEFERVVVVLDDEESSYNLFSYEKYFGITPLSETDRKNREAGKDSVIERTRRLFYVCCSRAKRDLAVVLFTKDTIAARAAIKNRGFFPSEAILGLTDISET